MSSGEILGEHLGDKKDTMNAVGDVVVKDDEENVKNPDCCRRCTNIIIRTLENAFGRLDFKY